MDDKNVIHWLDAKAKAVGVSPQLLSVIQQLNDRFGIQIDVADERLSRFKMLFPALDQAAAQHHDIDLKDADLATQRIFEQGVELGKAQMMTDVIICILEQDGLVLRQTNE
ncbi:MAG: hypothetical protein R3309_10095 [Reinekea sp.]|nr:hypothetical protein [Reinekea sp.]MDX1474511.1 hypothetical protein [Reinekea sp.]